jgi:hypothetical protein
VSRQSGVLFHLPTGKVPTLELSHCHYLGVPKLLNNLLACHPPHLFSCLLLDSQLESVVHRLLGQGTYLRYWGQSRSLDPCLLGALWLLVVYGSLYKGSLDFLEGFVDFSGLLVMEEVRQVLLEGFSPSSGLRLRLLS